MQVLAKLLETCHAVRSFQKAYRQRQGDETVVDISFFEIFNSLVQMPERKRHIMCGTVRVGFQHGKIFAREDNAARGTVHSECRLESERLTRKRVADRSEIVLNCTKTAYGRSILDFHEPLTSLFD